MNFYSSDKSAKQALRIITLSGTESVTKNMTVYEYGEDIIIVDCGVGFPDTDMPGVDVVIPDFSYILENSHRVKGLFITHGHEDHIGAVPYLLEQLEIPIYCNNLVQGFLTEKLSDKAFKELLPKAKFHLLTPDTGAATVGAFTIEAFRVNHSVPSSMGYAIKTPQGVVLHMADYKVDWTPVLDPPIDLAKIASYGNQGVLCLLSDSLGSTTEGYSKSESTLNDTFSILLEGAEKRQVFVTTISSNISRMYQIIDAAIKHGRKVVLAGRSIEQSVSVARRLGYLPFDEDVFVKEEDAANFVPSALVYVIAGCYGQQGSALDRVSRFEHNNITMEKNALVIFSADPNPPGVEIAVERVMANITLAGGEVIYSKIQDNLHVSGHGPKGDLTMVAAISKAKYYIPIGGTIIKMRAYTNMLGTLGIESSRVFECQEGESVEFSDGTGKKGPTIETKPVFIDTSRTNTISPIVVKDRTQLSTEGVFVVVVPTKGDGTFLSDKIEVITRGFVYVKESQELLEKSRRFVAKSLEKYVAKGTDWSSMKRKLENDLDHFLYKETRNSPLIIVHSLMI